MAVVRTVDPEEEMMLLIVTALALQAEDPAPPPDLDGDGFIDGEDCNDNDAGVFPGALDVCDDIDNDCDGQIDELDAGTFQLYVDADGDGWGTFEQVEFVDPSNCPLPAGYAIRAGDCDDAAPLMNPGQLDDQCDGVDDDCDGLPDDDAPGARYNYFDLDGDGHAGGGGVFGCPEEGAVGLYDDCDESDPDIYVGAPEVYEDGVDQDCNGFDDPWPDADGDGFGMNVDCDDQSVSVHPDASEACGNNLDDDCDGDVDEGCDTDLPPPDSKGCSTVRAPWSPALGWISRRR